ncbi:MAG: M24 family metallopeptidase [Muribaculaceae bacterium]
MYNVNLQLLPPDELALRIAKVQHEMLAQQLDAVLLCDNANLFYLTGRVFCGFIYINVDGSIHYFVRRPSILLGDNVHHISRPDEIASLLPACSAIGLEVDTMPYSRVDRLLGLFPGATLGNASKALRAARAVKTPLEIHLMEESGIRQTAVYDKIPELYREGMTDIEFQIEIERELRLQGCLGQFRVTGPDLEIFMGNILTGENAYYQSPYDFAMGGAGMHPSLPVGANGTLIRPNMPVMVDANGNFNGYMTDMTRCYIAGTPSDIACKALRLSNDICARIAEMAVPGARTADLYNEAVAMANAAGLGEYFMGYRHHAGFVGHGLGISINEAPVLAPRSREVLVANNAIAVEPKFVIPGTGAVGVENTYIVGETGAARRLTNANDNFGQLA